MFSTTFISLFLAVMFIVNFLQPIPVGIAETTDDTTYLYQVENNGFPLILNSYSFNYIGSIDAKEKTVADITSELQIKAQIKDVIGNYYSDDQIQWTTSSSQQIENDQYILFRMIRLSKRVNK
jgi:hypothetical protein